MGIKFGVVASTFALYEAFKKDCEALGYTYCEEFSTFEDNPKYKYMVFSNRFFPLDGDVVIRENSFAMSDLGDNGDIRPLFNLNFQYGDALNYAKAALVKTSLVGLGQLAVLWDERPEYAIICHLSEIKNGVPYKYYASNGVPYRHAIPFTSIEDYDKLKKS